MVALAIAVLISWALWEVKKGAKISYDNLFTAAIVGIPSGIVFARLLHVIDLWGDYYGQHLEQIIGGAGLSAYGAVLGATLGIWIYSRFSRSQFGYFADMVAPGIILAQMVGRVGCTINGCCYGVPTSLPWGITYSSLVLPSAVHPTTVYEIIWNLLVFVTLLLLRGRLKPSGSLFAVYLSLYSVWRLGSDFLRDGLPFLFGLHQAQVIAIVVLAITIPFIVFKTWGVKRSR